MSSPPSLNSKPQTMNSTRGSWLGVVLVAAVLLGIAGFIVGLWYEATVQPSLPIEHYIPLPNGASTIFTVTKPDGSTTYRSRNVLREPANVLAPDLPLNAFISLMDALHLDPQTMETGDILAALSKVSLAQVTNLEYDASGAPQRTTSVLLVRDDSLSLIAQNDVTFSPPLPLWTTADTPRTMTGTVNSTLPYTTTVQGEAHEPVDTAVGRVQDCVRVGQTLEVGDYNASSRTWYCAGVGEVRDETTESTASGAQQTVLNAASVDTLVKGESPTSINSEARAELQYTFSLAMSGAPTLEWEYKEPPSSRGITTAILPFEDVLLYGTESGALVALDRAAERPRWRFQTGGAIFGTPVVAGGIAYFGSADTKVYAIDAANGGFVWAFLTQDVISNSPAVAGGVVYVGSEDGTLYALDARTGALKWRRAMGGPVAAPPRVSNGIVYDGSDSGALYALDAATGELRWAYATGEAITARATLEDDVVYIGSLDQSVYALETNPEQQTGQALWSFRTDWGIPREVVVSQGRVYVIANTQAYALDAASGKMIWRFENSTGLIGSPVVMGDQIFVTGMEELIVLEATTGREVSRTPSSLSTPRAGLSVNGDKLLVGHTDGTLQLLGGKAP